MEGRSRSPVPRRSAGFGDADLAAALEDSASGGSDSHSANGAQHEERAWGSTADLDSSDGWDRPVRARPAVLRPMQRQDAFVGAHPSAFVDFVLVHRLKTTAGAARASGGRAGSPAAGPVNGDDEIDGGESGDTALLLPPGQDSPAQLRAVFVAQLVECGLSTETVRAVSDPSLYFTLVHASGAFLRQRAERAHIKMPLQGCHALRGLSTAPRGQLLFSRRPTIEIDVPPVRAAFKESESHRFEVAEGRFLTSAQRSALVWEVLSETAPDNDPQKLAAGEVGIQTLILKNVYADAFPLHEVAACPTAQTDLDALRAEWAPYRSALTWQPINLIRLYFGESIAFYFAWLGFYTSSLMAPSLLGLLVVGYGLLSRPIRYDAAQVCASNITMCALCETCDTWQLDSICSQYTYATAFDNEATIAFAFFMGVWASVFIDFWKRTNARLAQRWDVDGYESLYEPCRPQFKAVEYRINPVTGRNEKWYPRRTRLLKFAGTMATILFLCSIVLICLVGILVYKLSVTVVFARSSNVDVRTNAGAIVSITGAVVNLVAILILDAIYKKLAVKLTEWENHRRQSVHDRHLAAKIFAFQFVNSYSSLFYLAFFKGKFTGYPGHYERLFGYRQDACAAYGCMLELSIQLAVIMLGTQFSSNFMELVLPRLQQWWQSRKSDDAQKDQPAWERQYFHRIECPEDGLLEEYLEILLQYGFVTLFVVAFPLAPLFALLNNLVEIRLDAGKLVHTFRRPVALRTSGPGIWADIVHFVSTLSVITNGLVISFSSTYVQKATYAYRHEGSLAGYISTIHPLSPVRNGTAAETNCRYLGLRDDEGRLTTFSYEVLLARLACFIVFEHAVFLFKFLAESLIPDVPKDVRLAKKRQEYLAREAFEQHTLQPVDPERVSREDMSFRQAVATNYAEVVDRAFGRRRLSWQRAARLWHRKASAHRITPIRSGVTLDAPAQDIQA